MQIDLPGGRGTQLGSSGPPILLVSGAPVGPALFRVVQSRLAPLRSVAVQLDVPERPSDEVIPALGQALGEIAARLGAQTVFGHGTATPVVLAMPAGSALRRVISNGPLSRPDPILRALAALPTPALERGVLRPEVLERWLASSAGLRRAVTNPYAMHRDIVVMLCREWHGREAEAARWIKALAHVGAPEVDPNAHLVALWGDHDPLHPIAGVEALATGWASFSICRVPGGRMFHVEERPWVVADTLCGLQTGSTVT
ncbi:MAG: hypothetical protein H6741_26240 [Alphaproteobacteria bacterium]|nr:hypothetical protein [Alphaproteobacteria bacterium]